MDADATQRRRTSSGMVAAEVLRLRRDTKVLKSEIRGLREEVRTMRALLLVHGEKK